MGSKDLNRPGINPPLKGAAFLRTRVLPCAHHMDRLHYRGSRGGEKQRKRIFYQLLDQVRTIFRQLFPRASWVKIDYSYSTPALVAALESIVSSPNDALNPSWHAVAQFSTSLRRFIPAGAPQGAAYPPAAAAEQNAEEEQPANEPGQASGEPAAAGGRVPEEEDTTGIAEAEPSSVAADQAAIDPELAHPPPAGSDQPDLDDAIRGDPALDAALLEEGVSAEEGAVQEEGAALGAPGEADTTANLAREEEAPEQDEYVEVEVDSETLSIYEPLPPSGDEADDLPEEPSSSTAPAPVGSGSLSSRTPLVLRPRQPGYPPVRIDREGTWVKIGGPLAQPEPVHPPAVAPDLPEFPHEAADPYNLPDSAWLDPAAFAQTHSASGVQLGIPHYKLEAAPEGAAPGAPGPRRRVASAPPTSEPREAKSRRVFVEEAPFAEEAPKKGVTKAKVIHFARVRTSTAKPSAPVVVPPRPALHIPRAPPPKRASVASAPEAAAEPDLAADTISEPPAWRSAPAESGAPAPRVSLRAASALPRAAAPVAPNLRPAQRARSSSPVWEDRGEEVGFGENRLDPEIAGAELEEVPPPQPAGLVRADQGAAPGAPSADQAAQEKAKALGVQQPVTPPKGLPVKRPPTSLGPPPPLPVERKAPPTSQGYKGPPHGAFVRGIRSRSPQGDRPPRSKPKPLTLVHPQHRARNSFHEWAKGQGRGSAAPEGAAFGAPRLPPQVTPKAPSEERVQINIVLDWHKCLDRGWNYSRARFTNRTALAINSLCAALRPCTINILSYANENADLYLHRDLIPAQRQLEALPSRPAFARVAQVSARVGPNGKARQLHFVQAHFFVDDKPQIIGECRRTGCVCLRAYPAAGEQGLLDNLLEIQQQVDQVGRSNLRVARRLADSELFFER